MKQEKLPWCASVRDGRLFIEECDVTKLAEEFGTPLFVVSESHLIRNFRAFQDNFQKYWPEGRVRVMAAVKANPTVAVRRALSREGVGCDTFGQGELETAIRGGVPYEDIAVNGSIKSREIIRKAIDLGIHVILDNKKELPMCAEEAKALGKIAQVLLRVKPYLEDLDDQSDFFPQRKIREMTQTVKYGIPTSEVLQMLPQFAEYPEVELVGVHVHLGRHSKKLAMWESLARAMTRMITTIRDGVGADWSPHIVSFGGGFPAEMDIESRVAVTDYETPSVEDFAKAITGTFRDEMKKAGFSTDGLLLEVEPGRAMYNETGMHLTTVHNTKHETSHGMDYRWAETDTSECFLSIGSLNVKPPFPYVVANKADRPSDAKMDIVGITCNYECLCEQAPVPMLEEGDVIAFLETGSYIEPYTCNFNALPRPGMVLVRGDSADLVKRHETNEEVFSRHVVPERLEDIGR